MKELWIMGEMYIWSWKELLTVHQLCSLHSISALLVYFLGNGLYIPVSISISFVNASCACGEDKILQKQLKIKHTVNSQSIFSIFAGSRAGLSLFLDLNNKLWCCSSLVKSVSESDSAYPYGDVGWTRNRFTPFT